jgi:putative redox protein
MTSLGSGTSPIAQAVVGGSLDDAVLTGHAGGSKFPIGGPGGRDGTTSGPNPYDLLSASLAACTAMTIRLHARHKSYPLSHVEVAVSYYHAEDNGRGSFQRVITLRGGPDRPSISRGRCLTPIVRRLMRRTSLHGVLFGPAGAVRRP